MKKIIPILIILLFIGCKSSKVKDKETIVKTVTKDSIVYKDKIVVKQGLNDTIFIENPCDSLGNLKPIATNLISSAGNVKLSGENNKLTLEVDIKSNVDSIRVAHKSTLKSSDVSVKEVSKTKVYIWSIWTWIFLIIAIVELVIIFKLSDKSPKSIIKSILNLLIPWK